MKTELTAMQEMDIDSGLHHMSLSKKDNKPWYVGMPHYRVKRILQSMDTHGPEITLYRADFKELICYLEENTK